MGKAKGWMEKSMEKSMALLGQAPGALGAAVSLLLLLRGAAFCERQISLEFDLKIFFQCDSMTQRY